MRIDNMKKALESLNNINAEIDNDTDFSLEELEAMKWEKVGEESAYGVSAITYINETDTVAKKVWHDGMIEYYLI